MLLKCCTGAVAPMDLLLAAEQARRFMCAVSSASTFDWNVGRSKEREGGGMLMQIPGDRLEVLVSLLS